VAVTHSRRTTPADEPISRSTDLSMARIGAPVEQGEQDARQAMA
jgi:hypothetical protein